jgi:hypothetical protein
MRLRNWLFGKKPDEAEGQEGSAQDESEAEEEERKRRRREEAKKKRKPYGGYFGERKGYGKMLDELDEE